MEPIPFHPMSRDWQGHSMPSSVPPGLKLELSRAKLIQGEEATFREWMDMLNARYDECEASLATERSSFEATFLSREADGSLWMYHLSVAGTESLGLDPTASSIDADHYEYGLRTKMRGWEELQPMFMLAPRHIRDALVHWGATGSQQSH